VGQKDWPSLAGRVNSSRTSRGSHIRALYEAIAALIDFLPDVPSERRVRLRNELAALRRAYPRELTLSDTDVAQFVQEMDDEPIEDLP